MSDFTPKTDYVRRVYSLAPVDLSRGGMPNTSPEYAGEQFDRWLAAHDAEVRKAALEEAAVLIVTQMTAPDRLRPQNGRFATDLANDIEWAALIIRALATPVAPETEK